MLKVTVAKAFTFLVAVIVHVPAPVMFILRVSPVPVRLQLHDQVKVTVPTAGSRVAVIDIGPEP